MIDDYAHHRLSCTCGTRVVAIQRLGAQQLDLRPRVAGQAGSGEHAVCALDDGLTGAPCLRGCVDADDYHRPRAAIAVEPGG
jgi:hypothetical protein